MEQWKKKLYFNINILLTIKMKIITYKEKWGKTFFGDMKVKYCEEFNLSSYNPSKPEKQAKKKIAIF